MASQVVTLRVPAQVLAQLDAEAERAGAARSDVILAALAAYLSGYREEPPPTATHEPRPAPAPTAPKAERAREAARAAEAKTGVAVTAGSSRARAAMDRAGTVEWDPNAKRTPYQKGSAGAGKGRKGR